MANEPGMNRIERTKQMPTGGKRRLLLLCSLAVLMMVFHPVADSTEATAVEKGGQRVPFPSVESIEFSWDTIPSQGHPFLFITKRDTAQARKRIAQREYILAYEFLTAEADKARGMTPKSIDPSWWADVKDKPWSDTYPIIYQKTCLDPVRITLPGYYAALNHAISGGEEDLVAARKILLHLADYSFEFEHYDVGMNYAVWGHYALNAYARRIKLADEFTYLYAHKAYRDPRYAWLLSQADHKRAEMLTLVEFKDSPNQKTATAADLKCLLYEGVKQSRTITVTADYVLDVFQIAAKAEHDIKCIIHTVGTPDSQRSSVELKPAEIKLPGPGSWLRDFRVAATDQPIRLEWSEDSVNFAMTMASVPKTKLITCGYPTTDEPNCPTTPMVLIERRAAATAYAAVYQAGKQQLPKIRIKQVEAGPGRLGFQVTGSWGQTKHLIGHLP